MDLHRRRRTRRAAARTDARRVLDILTAAWSGDPVYHWGKHYTVDGMRFLPRPVQRPGVPVWVAGFYGKPRPLRRAARYQGFIPVNLEHADQCAAAGATWWLVEFPAQAATVDLVRAVIRDGPAAPS
jgi:alkanesulfonate monooxygenase SsuD/methylene tetrahydromethanopterin reductase-like flavin-dependent oxidoreductase (luciferase family)